METLTIRFWKLTDAPALLNIYRTSTGLERQLPALASEKEAQELIEDIYLPAEDRATFCLANAAGPLGHISLNFLARDDSGKWDTAWVSYWITDSLRGQGYTKHAVRAVCDWALGQGYKERLTWGQGLAINTQILASMPSPELRRLELGYRLNNPASGAVAAAAGFTVEGIEREKFKYGDQTFDAAIAARLR